MLNFIVGQYGWDGAIPRHQPPRLQELELNEVVCPTRNPSPDFRCHCWVRILHDEPAGLHANHVVGSHDRFDGGKMAPFVSRVDEGKDVNVVPREVPLVTSNARAAPALVPRAGREAVTKRIQCFMCTMMPKYQLGATFMNLHLLTKTNSIITEAFIFVLCFILSYLTFGTRQPKVFTEDDLSILF